MPAAPQWPPVGSGEARVALFEANGLKPEARETAGAALPLGNGIATLPAPARSGSDIAPAVALASASVPSALTSREFAPAFVSQVALWVRDGVQEARLQLHPAELGPISIQIALDGMAAHVDFHAQHALTREAIEGSLPALAGALRDAGFTLAGGGVFGQAAGERGARTPDEQAGQERNPHPLSAAAASADSETPRRWRLGLVDVFA
jgi:flagellar hook-length control protein FliK